VQFDFPFDFAQDKPADDNSKPLDIKPYKSGGGKMVWNKELKREIPEGWDPDLIENILEKENKTPKVPSSEYELEGEIPIIDQSTDFICGYTNQENARIRTSSPRIVFGDHTRILKLINFDFARGADGTQVLLSNNSRVPQHYFYQSLLMIDLSNYGYARHFKFLKDSKIIQPDLKTSQSFERQADSWYKSIKQNIFENKQLSSLRDWLLPMLMNGQVRIL
jgi:type I restriction enzyme S subunit